MDLQFDHKTMNTRIKRRAVYLAIAITLVLMLLLLVVIFLSMNSILSISIGLGFFLQGTALSVIAGAIIGFVYYVASGWIFLGE